VTAGSVAALEMTLKGHFKRKAHPRLSAVLKHGSEGALALTITSAMVVKIAGSPDVSAGSVAALEMTLKRRFRLCLAAPRRAALEMKIKGRFRPCLAAPRHNSNAGGRK